MYHGEAKPASEAATISRSVANRDGRPPRASTSLTQDTWLVSGRNRVTIGEATSTAKFMLMGAPGAGKGTQASLLARRCAMPAISTGEIFRANLAQQTEIGVRAKEHMDAGEYVPDDVTNAMVRDRLSDPDALRGFVLDGYPRTEAQVKTLDEMLAVTGSLLDAVVVLTVDRPELLERLLNRAGIEGRGGRHF